MLRTTFMISTLVALIFSSISQADDSPESTPSSPPLFTDDVGTTTIHRFEFNGYDDMDSSDAGKTSTQTLDLSYGLRENVQIQIIKSFYESQQYGAGSDFGRSDTQLALKWRFYDRSPWALSMHPSVSLNDASQNNGRIIQLPFAVTREFSFGAQRTVTVLGNLGITKNLDVSESDGRFASIAGGTNVGEEARIMTEVVKQCDSHFSNCRNDSRFGIAKTLKAEDKLSFEKTIFASVGAGVDTANSVQHQTLQIGINIQ